MLVQVLARSSFYLRIKASDQHFTDSNGILVYTKLLQFKCCLKLEIDDRNNIFGDKLNSKLGILLIN
ncbi:hypothetical protein NPIL_544761 [Nephila pilipes]|uniref:Uncharacterized protein n=1 Tax=Nephila pilipes TaxID=299642 RepID=A0A8X6QVX5_NEPPI|nr:hypothetical protein NPIL_544761 [Nephila pilipes]